MYKQVQEKEYVKRLTMVDSQCHGLIDHPHLLYDKKCISLVNKIIKYGMQENIQC